MVNDDIHMSLGTTTVPVRIPFRPKFSALDNSFVWIWHFFLEKWPVFSIRRDVFCVQEFFFKLTAIWSFPNSVTIFSEIHIGTKKIILKSFSNLGNFSIVENNFCCFRPKIWFLSTSNFLGWVWAKPVRIKSNWKVWEMLWRKKKYRKFSAQK